MVKLYDKGYIDDPTRFDEVQIRCNILDMGIKGMISYVGNVELSTEFAKYAIYKNHDADSDVKEFLDLLYNTLKYKEYCADINNFYDYYNFSDSSKCSVSLGLKLRGAMISPKSDYRLSEAIVNCFLDKDCTAVCKDFHSILWDIVMDILDIPESDRLKDGIFESDLSHDQELNCMKLILDGNVFTNGKYSDKLQNWLFNHKWKSGGMTTNSKGLYEYLFTSQSSRVFDIENSIFNKEVNNGNTIYAIDGGKYYISKKIDNYKYPLGCFVVLGGSDELLPNSTLMSGYTGECYTEDYLLSEGYLYIGCPFEINTSFKESILVFDIEQVDLPCETWFKTDKMSWFFYDTDDEELQQLKCSFDKDSLEYKLFNAYKDSLKGNLVTNLGKIDFKKLETAKRNIMKYMDKELL